MSDDISRILDDWQYNPDAPTVRIIRGDDGREMVQLRIDLGLLQMAMDGRPDGQRPEGCESWLDYYRRQQERHDAAHPDSAPFQLDIEACRRLWSEGIQYYHRYVSFWHLTRFDLCARDTRRNLELFAFVREYGPGDRAKMQFDQWRPYVLMMHARAVATPLAEAGQIAEALGADRVGHRRNPRIPGSVRSIGPRRRERGVGRPAALARGTAFATDARQGSRRAGQPRRPAAAASRSRGRRGIRGGRPTPRRNPPDDHELTPANGLPTPCS